MADKLKILWLPFSMFMTIALECMLELQSSREAREQALTRAEEILQSIYHTAERP